MNFEKAYEIAMRVGFDAVFPLDPTTLEFRQDVRDMCEKCEPFTEGILLQTISRNLRNIMEDGKRHGTLFAEFVDELRAIDSRIRPMGAGGCHRCGKCSYPDAPCVNPQLVFPSMEASGLLIIDLCKANNIPYYYGKGTVAYMACCLLNPVDDLIGC